MAGALGLIPAHAGKTKSDADPGRVERAHPRSRGENMYPSTYASAAAGSSPLTRGKRGRSSVRRRGRGLIPAHAGKTVARVNTGIAPPAHPRSRGENLRITLDSMGDGGSSPLTRGKLRAHRSRVPGAGLIPAHAGKMGRTHPCPSQHAAHPRSRGENGGCYAVDSN